jgi:uncharacterized protein (TIGR02391 family)
VARYEVAVLFGTLVAETILASVHVRAHQQAGHMDASDLIKALQRPCEEGVVHIWKISAWCAILENHCGPTHIPQSATRSGRQLMPTLLEIFPDPQDLLALQPEELAGILLIEFVPDISESEDGFRFAKIKAQVEESYPRGRGLYEIVLALTEALSWLETQGIIVQNPLQLPALWYRVTRRGRILQTHADLEAFRKGRLLSVDLLQQSLTDKVHHLFLRGDHDTAVFQAFKEVEIAVRKAGNYANDLLGVNLMRAAFHPDKGPLSDKTLVPGERESEMHLFSGACGHAKNPPSHRDVNHSRQEAARLIVFASHLLAIVEERAAKAG